MSGQTALLLIGLLTCFCVLLVPISIYVADWRVERLRNAK